MSQEQHFAQADVDGWIHAVEGMYYGGLWDPGHAAAAERAAARLMAEYAIDSAPPQVLAMVSHAIEVGYLAALEDVRDGAFDKQVRTWRPDLASGS